MIIVVDHALEVSNAHFHHKQRSTRQYTDTQNNRKENLENLITIWIPLSLGYLLFEPIAKHYEKDRAKIIFDNADLFMRLSTQKLKND
jgi:hypothetical protein